MSVFYTNSFTRGNYVFVRGYDDGRPFKEKVDFLPTIFTTGKPVDYDESDVWHTLYGQQVYPLKVGGIRDTKEFKKKYEDVHGFEVFGSTGYNYEYIANKWTGDVPYDATLINAVYIDIETDVTLGRFPEPSRADEEIVLITVKSTKRSKFHTFTFKDTKPKENTELHIASSERHMLLDFLEWWSNDYPDVVTGWNTEGFDIPYLVNRIKNVLGEDVANKLSPWGFVYSRDTHDDFGNDIEVFDIQGINHLDYLALYKKFTYVTRESYKLDHIGEVELGEKKVDYSQYGSFKNFLDSNWDLFTEYNIKDVELVVRLNDKMKLLELAYSLAYYAKINIDEVFGPVKLWDNIIYNDLLKRKIVIPNKKFSSKSEKFAGAFVRDPIVGMHKYVVSFDLTSLYPHLIMGSQLSPEKLQSGMYPGVSVEKLLSKEVNTDMAKELGVSLCASGYMFKNDEQGMLPRLMESMFIERKTTKNKMLDKEQELENIKTLLRNDPDNAELKEQYRKVDNEISELDNRQMALKIALNSAYGATGNPHFRYYDLRIAESITLNGQLAIQWIANYIDAFLNKTFKTENVNYVIYCDTDSNYICLEELINQYGKPDDLEYNLDILTKFCQDVLQKTINRGYEELADYLNSYAQKLFMKLEVITDVGIFCAKKNYCLRVHSSEGVKYGEPKIKVVGLAMVRSSTPAVVREALREVLPVVLDGEKDRLHEYIEDFRKTFLNYSPEEIAFPRSVNGVNEYRGVPIYRKGTPIAVRSALLYNHHIKRLGLDKENQEIKAGDKIKFIYVKKPNPFFEDVIGFPEKLPKEFGLHSFIDYDKQFQKTFIDAIEKVLTPIGWTAEPVADLEEFFG